MLVLTRKSEQKIIIGKDIIVTVLRIQGDQVSIGIDAPKKTPIYREELLKEIEQENAVGAISTDSTEPVDIQSIAHKLQLKRKARRRIQKISKI